MAAIRNRLREVFRSWNLPDSETRSQNADDSGTAGHKKCPSNNAAASDQSLEDGIRLDDINSEPNDEDSHELLENFGLFLHTTAGGNVYNIINSKDVHVGNRIEVNGTIDQRRFFGNWYGAGFDFTHDENNEDKPKKHRRQRSNTSQTSQGSQQSSTDDQQNRPEDESRNSQNRNSKRNTIPEISDDIKTLMYSKLEPTNKYLQHISWNLGKEWKEVFVSLGYKYKMIETFEIDASRGGYSVREARYRLLRDWMGSHKEGSLGCLATLLWNAGETDIVHELAEMYKKDEEQNYAEEQL